MFLLVGIKRILFPAIFVSIVYVWFVRRRRSPSFWVILTGVFWVVLFWTYLTMVHYGTISQLMHMFGISGSRSACGSSRWHTAVFPTRCCPPPNRRGRPRPRKRCSA